MAQQLVEAWRQRLRRRFPQFPQLIDEQVGKVWALRSNKTLTPEDLVDLENELASKVKQPRARKLQTVASEPTLSTASEVPPSARSYAPSCHSLARSESSLASAVKFKARMPYPKNPLQKPMDVWDHIVRYDTKHFMDAEVSRPQQVRQTHLKYREQLDVQMEDIDRRKQARAASVGHDRDAIALEQQRFKNDQEREREQRINVRNQLGKEMIQAHKLKERMVKKDSMARMEERELMLAREEAQQKSEAQHRARQAAIMQMRRTEKMREFQETLEERNREKCREREQDKFLAERYVADLDAKERQKQEELDARWKRIQSITGSMGASNKKAADMLAKADEDRMLRDIRIATEQEEEKRIRKEQHLLQCRTDMKNTLDAQVHEKQQRALQERVRMKERGLQLDDNVARLKVEEKEKAAAAFRARREMDLAVVGQIRERNSTHDEHHVRPDLASIELDYNQSLLRTMQVNGYDMQNLNVRPGGTCKGKRERKTVPSYVGTMSSDDEDDYESTVA